MDFDDKNANIIEKIKTIFNDNKGRYGYRRITLELKIQGIIINHKKVKRLSYIYNKLYKNYINILNKKTRKTSYLLIISFFIFK